MPPPRRVGRRTHHSTPSTPSSFHRSPNPPLPPPPKGGLKKFLFGWGFARKLHFLREGCPQATASPFFDRLVFGKVKERLGGRVRIIVSGGAPLAPHVEEFLRVAMCAPVAQVRRGGACVRAGGVEGGVMILGGCLLAGDVMWRVERREAVGG